MKGIQGGVNKIKASEREDGFEGFYEGSKKMFVVSTEIINSYP